MPPVSKSRPSFEGGRRGIDATSRNCSDSLSWEFDGAASTGTGSESRSTNPRGALRRPRRRRFYRPPRAPTPLAPLRVRRGETIELLKDAPVAAGVDRDDATAAGAAEGREGRGAHEDSLRADVKRGATVGRSEAPGGARVSPRSAGAAYVARRHVRRPRALCLSCALSHHVARWVRWVTASRQLEEVGVR